MSGFRLQAVHIGDETSTHHAKVEISGAPEADSSNSSNWVSVVIGRNGLGKSRLLSGIAALFARAADKASVTQVRTSDYSASFSRDGRSNQLWVGSGGEIQGHRRSGSQAMVEAMPRKTIAISATALDKFPLPRRQGIYGELVASDTYSYMGLRDANGRASAHAAVFRALEALFEAVDSDFVRRARVAEVFHFLHYSPRIEVVYRWHYSAIGRGSADLNDFVQRHLSQRTRSDLTRMVDSDPAVIGELERVIAEIAQSETNRGREIRLVADFRDGESRELAQFRDLQLLRRAGLVRMAQVELENWETGLRVNLRELSSGEFSLVTTFLALAATIEDDSLVLIDEPEVSLHPEWQSQYVGLLMRIFADYRGCHFVIATHSPLVVADLDPSNSNVVSLDPARRTAEPGAVYSGESADEILVRAFGVPGKNNLYLRQLLVEALRLAADGATDTTAFEAIVSQLVGISPRLDESSPIRVLTHQLIDARTRGGR